MTTIEWTDQTWNPVTGCSKVSAGCDHCYAETLALGRLKGKPGYPGLPWTPENAAENVVLRPERLDQPLRWRKPSMVFVNSMSDLFHPRVPYDFIAAVFDVMWRADQHIFQVLTKRPKRMREFTRRYYGPVPAPPLGNVWLGTSIESREHVGRADALGEVSAAVRFISAEPLLGPLIPETYGTDGFSRWFQWKDNYDGPGLSFYNGDGDLAFHWMIVGGESGQGHRPIEAEWVRDLRDVSVHEGVAFFFKQWGGIRPKSGGRELDGRTWDEYPAAITEGALF